MDPFTILSPPLWRQMISPHIWSFPSFLPSLPASFIPCTFVERLLWPTSADTRWRQTRSRPVGLMIQSEMNTEKHTHTGWHGAVRAAGVGAQSHLRVLSGGGRGRPMFQVFIPILRPLRLSSSWKDMSIPKLP